jgi:uncharacterized protein
VAVTISAVRLTVSHLPIAVHFYRDGLGLVPAASSSAPGRVTFETGGVLLELIPRGASSGAAGKALDGRAGSEGIVLACRAPSRADVDRILIEAIDAGGTLLRPALAGPDDAYVGTFADLDGYRWDVIRVAADDPMSRSEVADQTSALRSASALR